MPRRRRSSSAPLTKTFHVYYSKLKRSITTVPRKHHHNLPSIIINSSAYDLTSTNSTTSPDFATDDEMNEVPPDFSSTVFATHRFFFTSPGRSNSIVETRCITRDQEISEDKLIINIGGGIPVQIYSSTPFIDFRRSMQQMVEVNDILDVRAEHYKKFMHELLLCYLASNAKNTHVFIVEAFVDVLISLATSPPGYRCSTSYSTMASNPVEEKNYQ